MSIDLCDYQKKTKKAIKLFWQNRLDAVAKQAKTGAVDQGERAGVTCGKNMNGFLSLIQEIICKNGLKQAHICQLRRVVSLPGYFRPTKLWDILVINDGRLIAAIELKSQVGPSFGNNCNNRAEEAIGTAVDFWTAFREGAFGDIPRPFVGWLILVEDCLAAKQPVKDFSAHFKIFKEFIGASYLDRYDILCKKLLQEQLYSAGAVLASPRTAIKTGEHRELSEITGMNFFLSTLGGHVAAEAARCKKSKS